MENDADIVASTGDVPSVDDKAVENNAPDNTPTAAPSNTGEIVRVQINPTMYVEYDKGREAEMNPPRQYVEMERVG